MQVKLLTLLTIFSFVLFVHIHGKILQKYVERLLDATENKHNRKLNHTDNIMARIWSFFKTRYGRVYASSKEEIDRAQVFSENLQFVLDFNRKPSRTFQLALNRFSDWTQEEFENYRKGLIPPSMGIGLISKGKRLKRNRVGRKFQWKNRNRKRFFYELFHEIFYPDKTNYTNVTIPDTFDWREKNVVTKIKDQLKCGSCYAFSAVAVIESAYAIKNKLTNVTEFSPQQILDCSSKNSGCNGGTFARSIRFVSKNNGKLATLSSYPYVGKKEACRKNDIEQVYLGKIDYKSLESGDEVILAKALVLKGPLFVSLDTDSKLFMFYDAGVLKIDNCPTAAKDMDHGLTLVGYGYDKELQIPYWIIKNSHGTEWGEDGYLRLAKDAKNMCGISTLAFYAELS